MQLTVFGGTGGTGRQLIGAALDAGHQVTAAVREPARISTSHERLQTVRADVLDPGSLDGTMAGADAVVSALGAPANRPTTVYSTGVANILDAMRSASVTRFVGISAVPVRPREQASSLERLVVYPVLYRIFGEGYADMARMEHVLRRSDADWTILRPPRLTDRPATGRYRLAVNDHLPRGRTISRADLAAAMLRVIDEECAVRATVELAY